MPEIPTLDDVLKAPTYHGLNQLVQGESLERTQEIVEAVIASTNSRAKILLIGILSEEIGSHIRLGTNLTGEQLLENAKILVTLRALSDQVSTAAAEIFSSPAELQS